MLALLLNLGFAGGGTPVATTTQKGGISGVDRAWRRKQRQLAIQQGLLKDDEEVLAILLGTMFRR